MCNTNIPKSFCFRVLMALKGLCPSVKLLNWRAAIGHSHTHTSSLAIYVITGNIRVTTTYSQIVLGSSLRSISQGFIADYTMIMTSSSNTPSSKVSFKTDKSTQPTYRTQPSLNSLSIVSKVSTTPSENLNACVEEPNSQQDNEKIMSASGMVRRTRDLPQQRSDFHVADRQPDEEWSKKRAHSRYCLWLHRRHAFLNSQWRLPVVSISCTIGTICMFYALLRISDYHSPKNRLIGEYPRCVYFADSQSELGGESLLLEPKMEDYRSDRVIFEPMSKPEAQAHLQESKDYKKGHMQNFESESCKAQYKWQLTSFPTCNTVYEFDLTHIFDSMTGDPRARLLANGFWRDVWSVREEASNATRVLKTMRYKHPYSKIHSSVGTSRSNFHTCTHTSFSPPSL
jgi:hypothetical protein